MAEQLPPAGGSSPALRGPPPAPKAPLAPATTPQNVPASAGGAPSLARAIRASKRLKSWSQHSSDGSERRGWLHKKLPGKSKFISCWFEVQENSEMVPYYSDNPSLGPQRSNFLGYLDLGDAKFRVEEKKGRWMIEVKDRLGEKHSLIASSEEERKAWMDAFQKSKSFWETAQTFIAQWNQEEMAAKFASTAKPSSPHPDRERMEVVQPIDDAPSFWGTSVQDLTGRQLTLEELVSRRTSLFIHLTSFGSHLARQAVSRILVSALSEFLEHGLHVIVIGTGAPGLAHKVFLKEMAQLKDKLSGGFHIYCDQRGALTQLFRERFDIRSLRGPAVQNHKQQLYGLYVLNYFQGLVYGWCSEFLGQTPYLGELLSHTKQFARVFEESIWSHLKVPKFQWADLAGPADDATRTLKVDRASGFEYEFGTLTPPPGNVTRLLYNFCPYRDFFFEKSHTIWIADDIGDNGEGALVLILEDSLTPFARHAILLAKAGNRRFLVPPEACQTPKDFHKYVATKILGRAEGAKDVKEIKWLECDDPALKEGLLKFERQTNFHQYKFGVLYAPTGKIGEDQMYANMESSEDFEEFLSFLGTKVQLSGWDKFRGGLDHRGSDLTGTHSHYTQFYGNEIMFHVATMMPWAENDPSRKRHIGNDVVVIVFKDSGNSDKFDPTLIRSQYNHIFCVVEKVQGPKGPSYQIEFASKPGIPPFPPFLAHPPVLPINADSRTFLLTKLINSERSVIKFASILRVNLAATAEALLSDIYKTFSDPKRIKEAKAKDKDKDKPLSASSPALLLPKGADGKFAAGLDFSKFEGSKSEIAPAPAQSGAPSSPSPSPIPLTSSSPSIPTLSVIPPTPLPPSASPPIPHASPAPPVEAEPPPPALDAAHSQVPAQAFASKPADPYERLEVAVLKGLLKEEGLPWSTRADAYAALFEIYFPEELEEDEAPDDIDLDALDVSELEGWEEVLS